MEFTPCTCQNCGAPLPHRQSLMKASEVAERWQVATSGVYRLTREGKLPVVRVGKYMRYQLSEIKKFENDGGTE